MSALTFQGWLKIELRRLSPTHSLRLRRLAAEAQDVQPRITERLLAYAIETGTTQQLLALMRQGTALKEYHTVLVISKGRSLECLSPKQAGQLPWAYRKMLTTWRSVKNRLQSRSASKELRLKRSLELKAGKGIRTAQVCRDLNLNPGNINAYFKHRDTSKVSLETATRILKYLEQANEAIPLNR